MEYSRRFGGIARLYGEQASVRAQAAHVVVVGIGGVGSWAVEALARSGIGTLTLIDLDHINESNINRQIHALGTTLGAAKVMAMRERVLDIQEACVVHVIEEFVDEVNVASYAVGPGLRASQGPPKGQAAKRRRPPARAFARAKAGTPGNH